VTELVKGARFDQGLDTALVEDDRGNLFHEVMEGHEGAFVFPGGANRIHDSHPHVADCGEAKANVFPTAL